MASEESLRSTVKNKKKDNCAICKSRSAEPAISQNSEYQFPICRQCIAISRTLQDNATDTGIGSSDILTYERIGRDYSPDSGELVYIGPESKFYKISIEPHNGEQMIFLEPVLSGGSLIPVTRKRNIIAEAIDKNEFYLVGVNRDQVVDSALYWASALETAPSPEQSM